MPLPDYYAILEVPNNATLTQLKRSYRRLVRLYHPDLTKQTQDTRIKELNEAYDILSNPAKRVAYDALRMEEQRATALRDTIRRHQEEAKREPKMTWAEGVVGFVRELKKGMQEE